MQQQSAGELALSVVVTTDRGSRWVGRCLQSLADQTLSTDRFEVVLVQHGPDDGTAAYVAQLRASHPALALRHVRSSGLTRAAAKNLGLRTGRGVWVTFVHDEDWVAPTYLEALLDRCTPGLVALGLLVDVTSAQAPVSFTAPRLRRVLRHQGRTVRAGRVPAAFGYGPAKAVEREVALGTGFDPDLTGGEDVVFWARILLASEVRVQVCGIAADAIYYRSVRKNPHLPERDPLTLLVGLHRLLTLPLVSRAQLASRNWMVTEETAVLNRYLRTYPDAHRIVVEERRRLGLTVVELSRLNRGVARDLAILYTAVPYVDTSANVAARRIRAAGTVVDVLSADMSRDLTVDESAGLVWAEFVDQSVQTETVPATIWWPGINSFCRHGLHRITTWERAKGRYRTVYSRTMHPASHVLAAWYKIRNPEVVWTAEFSDPILHNVLGAERESVGRTDPVIMGEFRAALVQRGVRVPDTENMFVWIETLAYALADRLIFTNDHQLGYMMDHFGDPDLAARARARAVVAAHPTLPPEFYHRVRSSYGVDPGVVNLAYFGVFYVTRGLTEVVEAIRGLEPAIREGFRLHVFTSQPADLAAQAAEAGIDDVVVANAYVDYLEYLNLTTVFDVLLVNDARTLDTHDRNPYLPSKLSDYAGSGRPIWGIVEPGSVLSSRPLAYQSELGDVDGAREVLRQVVRGRVDGRVGIPVGASS